MSSQDESISERELAQQLQDELFSGKPRSVGEAARQPDPEDPTPLIEDPPGQPGDELEPPTPPPVEPEPVPTEPIVVSDEPGRDDEKTEQPVAIEPEPLGEEGEEGEEPEPEEDPNVVWAKKKYGDDPEKWAKAAFDQEQHISRMANQLKEAEQIAAQWYEYAQQVEQQARTVQAQAMPLSASEEEWIEQALMTNPHQYARAAIMNGNPNVFNAIVERVAEENPQYAAQIRMQVQQEIEQLAYQEQMQMQQQEPPLDQSLGASFARMGLDINEVGPGMMDKISELGEHHPYVQAMLHGDDGQRDLAVQAVYDLVRAGTLVTKKVRDDQRASQIQREGELRREAAGVVTGSPHTPPPQEDPFMAAMEEEWKARRQWGGDE